jgi:predicted DsbA family dithiol-disulfide isomerase
VARFPWFTLLRAATLTALVGSSALVVDYLSPIPSFCAPGSGCDVVRENRLSHLGDLGVPLPAVGLMAFTAVYTLSLLPGGRRGLAAPASIVGGFLGLALLLVQAFSIGVFCGLCALVDVGAIVAGIAGAAFLLVERSGAKPARDPLRDRAWIALGVLAVSAPLVWPSVRPDPEVPPSIASYYKPGKINVVEFVDFECPFCRLFHPKLKAIVAEYGDRVHFVRLDLPLAMHPLARGAARAHVCAVGMGKGDAMADALFDTEDLTEPGLLRAGEKVGIEKSTLKECMALPATEAAVVRSERLLRDAKLLQGLPTTFVGNVMLVGAQEDATLRDAFDRAGTGGMPGVPGPVFLGVFVVAALAVVFFGRASP